MNTTDTSASHPHPNHTGADDGTVAMAELLDLDAEVLQSYLSELTAWLGGLADTEPDHILDLGSGTGAGAIALAQRFARADVTAVDLSPQMLHRLAKKTSMLPLADRVHGVVADLDEGLPALETCDLVWAASSLHHLAHPDRVLAGIFDVLRPGGLLAVTEMDFFPRFLPDDIGIGRPGLEARIHTVSNQRPAADWTDHVARAGFTLEAKRLFTIDLRRPLPAAAVRYAQVCLQRMRAHLGGQLSEDDLAALDTVLDSEGPDGIPQRDDLTVRTTRTTWVARRP